MTIFDELRSLDDIQDFIGQGYGAAGRAGEGPLPLAVAEPGPLMEHAVMLSGADGLTRQQLLSVFERLGKERKERGLKTMEAGDRVSKSQEQRTNRAGRPQRQVVYRLTAEYRLAAE